jgi:hypothetical protein
VDEKKNGVFYGLAADFHPLVDTTDGDGFERIDAVLRVDGASARDAVLRQESVEDGSGNYGQEYRYDCERNVLENFFDGHPWHLLSRWCGKFIISAVLEQIGQQDCACELTGNHLARQEKQERKVKMQSKVAGLKTRHYTGSAKRKANN